MPRIKRWFPVSHDINRDPEIRELCAKFGLPGLRCWLEILSIADRNDGALPGDFNQYPKILAGAVMSRSDHCHAALTWLSRWLRVDTTGTIRVLNYGKYNKTAEHYPLPPDLPRPTLNDSYKNKNPKGGTKAEPFGAKAIRSEPASPEPSAGAQKPKTLDPRIKIVADQVYRSDPTKFKRLMVWVRTAEAQGHDAEAITEALNRFLPYIKSVGDTWWPYLNKLVTKSSQDLNARAHDAEHAKHKAENKELGNVFGMQLKQIVKGVS